jgi:RimJ/RimL family protein N-acetyltransferase
MDIRKTKNEDIHRIMEIYEKARKYMRLNGNPTQWPDGYPSLELIKNDIKRTNSYVCVEKDEIIGTFYFGIEIENTYLKIYGGKWLNDDQYGVIHRIAVDGHQKGIASYCIDWCYEKTKNIRIDTHRDNIPMQKVLTKNGFEYCGIIYLENGDERIAFQKCVVKTE